MKVRQKCLAGNPKTTTNSVGVSGFSLIYQRSSPDLVSEGVPETSMVNAGTA